METESTDEKFVDFIDSIDNLEKALIRIKKFDVFPNKEDRTKVKAKLTLEMYLSTKDAGEEKL